MKKEPIEFVNINHKYKKILRNVNDFGVDIAKNVNNFHQSFPEYEETPLIDLPQLAKHLGLKNIFIKDESYRFGLNAFKVLGGSYAIGYFLAQKLGIDISELPYNKLTSYNIQKKLGELTFVTATDGNHGRGIAWTANRLKQKSVVYMPKGSATERLENIQKLGSDASITDLNYDDAVRLANSNAKKYGWIMVQDTAWENYTKIPTWIMQGYTTMAHEAASQLKNEKPTHIFLQAGVGALSGAVTAYFTNLYGNEHRPIITIVEPNKANCIFKTAKENDGNLHFVTGDLDTIMAGLACGEPCSIGWDILRDHADNFISVPDNIAKTGMRILGNPISGDRHIISGESGAVTLGVVAEIIKNKNLIKLKEQLQLNEDSVILCFSTEGDTDKEGYRNIVWENNN